MSKAKIRIDERDGRYKAFLVAGNGTIIKIGPWVVDDWIAIGWTRAAVVKEVNQLKRWFAEAKIMKVE